MLLTHAQSFAQAQRDIAGALDADNRAVYVAALIKSLNALPAGQMEGMLIAFASFQITEAERVAAIDTLFDRIDAITNVWELDGAVEAARRLSLNDESLSAVFQGRAAAYADITTAERAGWVRKAAAGNGHSVRFYPKAA